VNLATLFCERLSDDVRERGVTPADWGQDFNAGRTNKALCHQLGESSTLANIEGGFET